jgi:DNA polymerase sigma
VRYARMPLLKLALQDGTAVKITLSPLKGDDIPALRTASLVARMLQELPHARQLLLVMKALMQPPNCLSNFVGVHTGGVSSFTVTLLVLAFCKLQVRRQRS